MRLNPQQKLAIMQNIIEMINKDKPIIDQLSKDEKEEKLKKFEIMIRSLTVDCLLKLREEINCNFSPKLNREEIINYIIKNSIYNKIIEFEIIDFNNTLDSNIVSKIKNSDDIYSKFIRENFKIENIEKKLNIKKKIVYYHFINWIAENKVIINEKERNKREFYKKIIQMGIKTAKSHDNTDCFILNFINPLINQITGAQTTPTGEYIEKTIRIKIDFEIKPSEKYCKNYDEFMEKNL